MSKVRQDVLNRRMDEILLRGVTVHAIVLPHLGESGNQRAVCQNLTDSTGGHLDILPGSAAAFPERLKFLRARLADAHRRMSNEYEIDFLREETYPPPLHITLPRS